MTNFIFKILKCVWCSSVVKCEQNGEEYSCRFCKWNEENVGELYFPETCTLNLKDRKEGILIDSEEVCNRCAQERLMVLDAKGCGI